MYKQNEKNVRPKKNSPTKSICKGQTAKVEKLGGPIAESFTVRAEVVCFGEGDHEPRNHRDRRRFHPDLSAHRQTGNLDALYCAPEQTPDLAVGGSNASLSQGRGHFVAHHHVDRALRRAPRPFYAARNLKTSVHEVAQLRPYTTPNEQTRGGGSREKSLNSTPAKVFFCPVKRSAIRTKHTH